MRVASRLFIGAATAVLVAAGSLAAVPGAAAGAADTTLRVGTLTLTRCNLGVGRTTYCGSLRTPLDWRTPATSATIAIGFGWVPATGTATGTLAMQEGGPGYPSTGTAADFAVTAGNLLEHRNLLLMDQRGSGRSAALNCPSLQQVAPLAGQFSQRAAQCADQLNHTWRDRAGHWMHASELFTSANTARDLAALITALRVGRVDYFGDSYGTYLGQSFIARYPQLLRSAVLDSTYETVGLDPWYRTTITTARTAVDAVCARALGCPPGSSWDRVGQLARLLRAHPVTGQVVGVDNKLVTVTVDVRALVNIVNDAGYDTEPYRELDAAVRAYLDARDPTPLLRLWARDIGYDYSDYVDVPASYYSDALYMAVACTDYPQLFRMTSTPTQRRAQLTAAVAALPADTFAPFTTREWLTTLNYTEAFTGCLDWPSPQESPDPAVPSLRSLQDAHVRTLVLNGELDSLTPAPDGANVARDLGSEYAVHVVAANTVHLVALENSHPCGRGLTQSFIANPTRPLDTRCAARIPPIRAAPAYPQLLADQPPAYGPAPLVDRQIAAAAVAAAGDAYYRYNSINGAHDLGLRGGTVRYLLGGADAILDHVRFTADATMSGAFTFGTTNGGELFVTPAGGTAVHVSISWGSGAWATATVNGVRLTTPAP